MRADPPLWEYGGLRLRRYVGSDHAAVLALHRQGLAQVGLRPGDGVYYDHDFFRMEEIYLRGDGEFLVGELDGRIVAMGGLRRADLVPGGVARAQGGGTPEPPAREHAVEMVRLRVRPEFQRRGYGEVLVRALEDRAAELGYRVLRADTTARQGPALALYRKFGWRETHREVINGIINIYLEKRIH
ncbi:GNAT family N-acetyltransferase [Actinomadura gamaensis]|uniref:GNAT family N-acetyltransferase n=1 Tax=Actinomadura gamaensis TaxID=1763541 RepID=A0ABV9U4Q1_9ACTN